jgi:predicted RNA-binding Zn-ribbon protein involved in translation (DUF1610 family)
MAFLVKLRVCFSFWRSKRRLDMAGEIKCPKCGSEQISAQKKGFSIEKIENGV